MRGRLLPLSLAVLLVAAGCLGTTDPTDTDDSLDSDGPNAPAFGQASSLPVEPGQRTLDAAPNWTAGEWWTYEMFSNEYGVEETFTIVAAGAEAGTFLVGLPADEVPVLPFILHLPGLGQVQANNLTYDAHDSAFELTRFPLEEGKTWEGLYWGLAPMDVTVEAVDGPVAELKLESSGAHVNYTYDATVGQITTWAAGEAEDPVWGLDMVDHGTGYEGEVLVPYDQDLDICHGRAAGALGIEACALSGPSAPQGTFEVPEGHEAATIALVASTGTAADMPAPGTVRIETTPPSGETLELLLAPPETGALQGHHLEAPAGTWSYEVEAAGAGSGLVEGVTYDPIEVQLPSGCILQDAGVNLTGTPC